MQVHSLDSSELRAIEKGAVPVHVVKATPEEARLLLDEASDDILTDAIDEAQAPVFSGQYQSSWLIIKIAKDA